MPGDRTSNLLLPPLSPKSCQHLGLSLCLIRLVSCVRLCACVRACVSPSDDSFSDTLSQKADSETSSGHGGAEDKCSAKDAGSPADARISEAYVSSR